MVEKKNWDFRANIIFLGRRQYVLFSGFGRHAACVEQTELQSILENFH